MSELPLATRVKRSSSAVIKNAANMHLHACLDEATAYKNRVSLHLKHTQFQNHVLQSAQRFYKNASALRPSSSQSSFGKVAKKSSSSRLTPAQSAELQGHANPEAGLVSALDLRAYRISEINMGFREGVDEKEDLTRRMEQLKRLLAQEKNFKAKVSIRNCKLMNKAELSNHHLNALLQQSRRLKIHINEVSDQNQQLSGELEELAKQNRQTRLRVEDEERKVNFYSQTVARDKRELDRQRKLLEGAKARQAVRYKEMTNKFMEVNQIKEEKALLLNHIDADLKKNL